MAKREVLLLLTKYLIMRIPNTTNIFQIYHERNKKYHYYHCLMHYLECQYHLNFKIPGVLTHKLLKKSSCYT